MDISPQLKEKLDELPMQPGVYRFFDKDGFLLYIGKATQLRSRVQSYFRESTDLSNAKKLMVSNIADIQITVVDNEPEALLLETTLIKKHKPPFNVVMKDDKNFQYIHITAGAFPSLTTTRQIPARGRTGQYFGPYVSGRAVKSTLRMLKRLFAYCESPPVEKRGKVVYPLRPCLDYHLGRCIGPCAKAVSPEEYQSMMERIAQFLRGDYEEIRAQVESEMNEASQAQQFEKAARLRDQLQGIDQLMVEQKMVSTRRDNADYLSLARHNAHAAVNVFTVRRGMVIKQQVVMLQHTRDQSDDEILMAFRDQFYAAVQTPPARIFMSTETRRGKNRKMLEMGVANAQQSLKKQIAATEKRERSASEGLLELSTALGRTPKELHRIEIYDISNFQGAYSVGSMVVFEDGMPAPSQYRKFKIKTVQGPNDFASMKEVLRRRLMHLPEKHKGNRDEWPRPDLLVIDGGKGQLSAAMSAIEMLDLDVPMISLAKREEEIFLPHQKDPVLLEKESPGYHLMQRMRDEAHRFAIGFYRKRHLKNLV
jgi:excinuclease ABC subunit C